MKEVKQVLHSAFAAYKTHAFSLMVIYASVFIILMAMGHVTNGVLQSNVSLGVKFIVATINFFVQSFAGLGLIYTILELDNEKELSLAVFMHKVDHYISFTATLFVFAVLLFAGLYIFIVPAFWVLARFGFAIYASVKKDLTLTQAFKESFRITKRHTVKLIAFFLILSVINAIAAFTIIGLLVSIPYSNIAIAHMYKHLSEEKVAHDPISSKMKITVLVLLILLFAWGVQVFISRTFTVSNYSLRYNNDDSLKQLKLAIETYYEFNGSFPKSLQDLTDNMKINLNIGNFDYSSTGKGYALCIRNSNQCVSGLK